jgi:RNA polymerase sigma-70 factor (ECF subfamily)
MAPRASHAERTDEDLAAEYVGTGDRAALDELVRRYSPRLRRMIITLLGPDEEAVLDAEQEVFVSLIRRISRFRGASTFATFFYRLARNRVLDLIRARQRYGKRVLSLAEPDRTAARGRTPEQAAMENESARLLRIALGTLAPDDQIMLYLKDGEGQSVAELGEALGMPVGTIKSRLARGRAKVAAALAELGYEG